MSHTMSSPHGLLMVMSVAAFALGGVQSAYGQCSPTLAGSPVPVTEPTGLVVSPDGQRIYASNGSANTITSIDADTRVAQVCPVSLPGTQPGGMAMSPDGVHLYVTLEGSDLLAKIESSCVAFVGDTQVGIGPSSVALSPDGTRAYVVNHLADSLSVVNTSTMTVEDTIALGSCGAGANDAAVHPDGLWVYVGMANSGAVAVISTDTVTDTYLFDDCKPLSGLSGDAGRLDITPNGWHLFVNGTSSATVWKVSTIDWSITPLPVGTAPKDVVLSPHGLYAFVTDEGENSVHTIKTWDHSLISSALVVDQPQSIAVNPTRPEVYVALKTTDKVSIVDTSSCIEAVPAVSTWGAIAMALTMCCTGTILFRRGFFRSREVSQVCRSEVGDIQRSNSLMERRQ